MIIGVPRERKQGETRVGLIPSMAEALVAEGHSVLIETKAGALSHYQDETYRAAGATVVTTLEEVWAQAELLVKVKEPAPEELPLLRPGLAVFSFLHPAAAPEMTKALLQSKTLGLDYDLVTTEDGRLPILRPMSEIAGKLAVYSGATALQSDCGGRGVLLGGTENVEPAEVVVVGAGAAGNAAARLALAMGSNVTILDISEEKLEPFRVEQFPGEARAVLSNKNSLADAVRTCDLLIGAVLVPGAKAPKLLTKELVSTMQQGAALVDICIDQGGFSETSRATSIAEPTYIENSIVHYCVPNMPALVPRTSTRALTNMTFPYIQHLAKKGIESALKSSVELRASLVTYEGEVTNAVIADALGYTHSEPTF